MSTKEYRPIVSTETYDDVLSLLALPISISFDKSLKILIKRYRQYEKHFKKTGNVVK